MRLGRGALIIAAGVLVGATSSCEDKAKVAQIKAQRSKIAELEARETRLKADLEGEPEGDPVRELAEAEAELEDLNEEIAALESERDNLKADFEARMEEFEEYKKKYPMRKGPEE